MIKAYLFSDITIFKISLSNVKYYKNNNKNI